MAEEMKDVGGRPRIYDDEFIESVGDRLAEYAQREDSLNIMGFRAEHGYTHHQMLDWCKRSERLSALYEQTKAIIGTRREIGALTGKLNAGSVDKRAWQYDIEIRERENELRRDPIENDLKCADFNKIAE